MPKPTSGDEFPDDPRDGALHDISAGEGEAVMRFKFNADSGKWALQEVVAPDAGAET